MPMCAQTEKTTFHAKTTVNRQSTHVDGHILICTHGPNLYVPKHIGRPMSGLFPLRGKRGGAIPLIFFNPSLTKVLKIKNIKKLEQAGAELAILLII